MNKLYTTVIIHYTYPSTTSL